MAIRPRFVLLAVFAAAILMAVIAYDPSSSSASSDSSYRDCVRSCEEVGLSTQEAAEACRRR